jgi:hypothetical protein
MNNITVQLVVIVDGCRAKDERKRGRFVWLAEFGPHFTSSRECWIMPNNAILDYEYCFVGDIRTHLVPNI